MFGIIGSFVSSLIGGLGNTDNNEETIAVLKEQLAQSQSSLKTFKIITYLLGASLIITVIVLLKKK